MTKLKITFFHTEMLHGIGRSLKPYKSFNVQYKTTSVRRALGYAAKKANRLRREDSTLRGKNTLTEFINWENETNT